MASGAVTCLVCNGRLNFHQSQTDRVCGAASCLATWRRLPANKTCAVCGRLRSMTDQPPAVCTSPPCLLEWERRRRAEEDVGRRAALAAEAERLRDGSGREGARRVPLVVIPAHPGALVNLPERRRRAFRDHLSRIIGEATARRTPEKAPAIQTEEAPAVADVLGRACGLCKGRCCSRGGARAYLTADRIRRYLHEHPEARPRDVLEAYLSRLPRRSVDGSCVYHGPQGCTLPRAMRADICNTHFCQELSQVRSRMREEGQTSWFFAAATPEAIRVAAFVAEGTTRPVASL